MLKLPSPADALPLVLGKKLTEAPVKPSDEWDLIRHDSSGALWKNSAGGRLQFIPNPSTLGPRKPQVQTPERLQKALDSVGEAFKPVFPVGSFVRYNPSAAIYHEDPKAIGCVDHINGNEIWCKWNNEGDILWAHKDELLPCDADGWIPYDPDRFPGVMDIEWRTSDGACGIWKMLPSVDAATWAAQTSALLSSWKPIL